MSEGRQLEVRPGDTVFVSVGKDGETHMHYMRPSSYHNLDAMLSAFEQFLRGCGFWAEGHLDFVDDDGESKWAVEVRNFLDRITDPEVYGLLFVGEHGREVVEDAVRLRDA